MKNDRMICQNFQSDYLIYVLSRLPKPKTSRRSAHRTALTGSLQLLRAIATPEPEAEHAQAETK